MQSIFENAKSICINSLKEIICFLVTLIQIVPGTLHYICDRSLTEFRILKPVSQLSSVISVVSRFAINNEKVK